MTDIDKMIREFFERGGNITICKCRKPKKSELTFRNDRGSVFNAGRKGITLRQQGFRGRSAALA